MTWKKKLDLSEKNQHKMELTAAKNARGKIGY